MRRTHTHINPSHIARCKHGAGFEINRLLVLIVETTNISSTPSPHTLFELYQCTIYGRSKAFIGHLYARGRAAFVAGRQTEAVLDDRLLNAQIMEDWTCTSITSILGIGGAVLNM